MHSRSVYLAAVLFSGTQFTSGTVTTLGGFLWILLSCTFALFLLPYGQHLLIASNRIFWERQRRKRQKTLFTKPIELPNSSLRQLDVAIGPVIQDQKLKLEKTFERVAELEKRLEHLCSIIQRKSPADGLVRNRRITMSESNLPACTSTNEHRPYLTTKWSASSSGDLRQVPSDLSHFRRRIDDSIREQRKTREIVEEAQDKLRNLRQHQAEVEASLNTSNPSTPRCHHSFDHHYYKSSRRRHYLHRSMSSLEEELNNKEDKSQFSTGDSSNRPSSSGGRLKGAYDNKNVSFVQPPEFDVTIAWPFQPISNSTPLRTNTIGDRNTMASQSEIFASNNYRLMLLEDMLATCKLQLEASLRSNSTANSEIHVIRDKLQKLQIENKTSLDRALHFESKYKNLVHSIQPRLYDLRNQTKSMQQRLKDVDLDVNKEMENYKENFSSSIQTIGSLIQRANCGNLTAKVNDLSSKLAIQERQRHEAESQVHQQKREILHLSNKIDQLTESLHSKETTISILEQDFHEEKEKTQKLEEQNDELYREKTNLQEDHDECKKKISSLRQKLDMAHEERDKLESDVRRLTHELSTLRVTSEARVEQLTAEINEAALVLEAEREDYFKRQNDIRDNFKVQTDMLQEKLQSTEAELERERNSAFDYKERVEDLQRLLRKSEENISDLKHRIHTESTTRIQELERQLSSAQQLALHSTNDWKKYEQRVNELEAELHEYKLQFERERREKTQAQYEFDTVKSALDKSEQILKETSLEKQHLLKSVTTFEQENRDLKKVCKQLHSQIDIYQKDTDSKYAKILEQKRTREQDEIKRLKSELAQAEKTHSQREQNLLQRLNETSVNFQKMKEQYDRRLLNQEREQTTFASSSGTTPSHSHQVQPAASNTSLHRPSTVHQTSTIVRRQVTYQSNTQLGRQV